MPGLLWLVGCVVRPPAPALPSPPLRFAVLGDRTDEPYDVAWRRSVAEIQRLQPDFVLTVGDFADDALNPADWDQALAATAALTVPIEHTPGNHDIVDDATAATFAARTGQAPHRAFDRGGVHFVIVDNARAESWEELDEAQRDWLQADLAAHHGAPIVVAMHKPFWALHVARGEPDPMHALFVQHGVSVVFTGHWHAHAYQEIDGVKYVIVGTSGGAHAGVPDPRRGNAFEYLWVTVAHGEVSMATLATGSVLPVDAVTLADSQRLRQLHKGAVRGRLAPDGSLEIAVDNVTEAPLRQTLTVVPGAWGSDPVAVEVDAEPGATFTTRLRLTPAEGWLPLPRIRLPYPLPDAGDVPYEGVVDLRRVATASRGVAPVLDGLLDDAVWEGPPTIWRWTTALGVASDVEPTELWLRHDDEALYVAARCHDTEPGQIGAFHDGRDGAVVFDDRLGLLLAPTATDLYWFYVTANGSVWDLHADRAAGVVDFDWNGVQAAATIDGTGWTLEARIPFEALGAPDRSVPWGFDVRRKQERVQAEATFTPGFGTADPDRLGRLSFGQP